MNLKGGLMRRTLIIFTSWLIAMSNAQAERFAWMPSYSSVSVSDPDGNTKDFTGLLPFEFSYIGDGKRSRIVWGAAFYDFNIDATTSNIGQDITGFEVNGVWAHKWAASRSFKPWLGIGFSASVLEFTSRHTIDTDGFLNQNFEDREDTIVNVILNATHEWSINKTFYWGVSLEYKVPIGDGLDILALKGIGSYKF